METGSSLKIKTKIASLEKTSQRKWWEGIREINVAGKIFFQETYILKKVGEGRLRNKVQCKRKDHEEKKNNLNEKEGRKKTILSRKIVQAKVVRKTGGGKIIGNGSML